MWKSLIPGLCLFLTFGLGDLRGHSEAGGGHKDFHTHLEVQVVLRDLESNPVNYTEKANGHHIEGLQLEVLQGPHLLFDIDLHLNQGLLPTKYFQKYHHKVKLFYWFMVLWFLFNGSAMSCKGLLCKKGHRKHLYPPLIQGPAQKHK